MKHGPVAGNPQHAATPRQTATPVAAASHAPAADRDAGARLDPPVRRTMEDRFQHDFSKVRIFADERANAAADRIGAAAFNVGNEIVFAKGGYDPASLDGRRLLAHELAHVVHRARAGTTRPGTAPADSPAERRADLVAHDVAFGARVPHHAFRDLGPAWDVHRQVSRVSRRGTVAHTGEVGRAPGETGVPTGTVEVRTGEEVEMRGGGRLPNVISLEYSGAISADTRWLQFVWFEMIATTPAGDARVAATIPTTSGTKPFTTDPAAPNWTVDSASTSNPFYEASGANLRTTSSTAMFDAPGGGSALPLAAEVYRSAPTATNVVFRAHFETYLIQRNHAGYVVRYTASTAFPRSGGTVRAGAIGYSVGTSGHATAIAANLRAILHAAYPAFTAVQ